LSETQFWSSELVTALFIFFSRADTSFYRLKAEQCSRMAEDEVDSGRRAELESERKLWLQIAMTEDDLDALRKKAHNLLNAQAVQKAGSSRKG
jgi:hypothetical protein